VVTELCQTLEQAPKHGQDEDIDAEKFSGQIQVFGRRLPQPMDPQGTLQCPQTQCDEKFPKHISTHTNSANPSNVRSKLGKELF